MNSPILRLVIAIFVGLGLLGAVAFIHERTAAEQHRALTVALSEPAVVLSEPAVVLSEPAVMPRVETLPQHPVEADPFRETPEDVIETAGRAAAPWAPGLRLERTQRSEIWDDHRAHIRDLTTNDVRAYAIGDLLPHGSLLVAIAAEHVDIMVGDAQIVRLERSGRIGTVHKFGPPRPVGRSGGPRRMGAMTMTAGLDPDYKDAVSLAIESLSQDDPQQVQALIDLLIAGGDPVVELLIPHVDRDEFMSGDSFYFPSGGGRSRTPMVVGDTIIAILEAITTQTFGDPMSDGIQNEQRQTIREAWRRWWSG